MVFRQKPALIVHLKDPTQSFFEIDLIVTSVYFDFAVFGKVPLVVNERGASFASQQPMNKIQCFLLTIGISQNIVATWGLGSCEVGSFGVQYFKD